MPGILLYCNGMKPKFKIKLQYDKKNNIWAAIAIILAVVMYVTIDFSIVALIAYGFLYYLVKSLHTDSVYRRFLSHHFFDTVYAA